MGSPRPCWRLGGPRFPAPVPATKAALRAAANPTQTWRLRLGLYDPGSSLFQLFIRNQAGDLSVGPVWLNPGAGKSSYPESRIRTSSSFSPLRRRRPGTTLRDPAVHSRAHAGRPELFRVAISQHGDASGTARYSWRDRAGCGAVGWIYNANVQAFNAGQNAGGFPCLVATRGAFQNDGGAEGVRGIRFVTGEIHHQPMISNGQLNTADEGKIVGLAWNSATLSRPTPATP